MPAQIGYFDTLKSVAGKVFTYLASITLTGTDGKIITCTENTSLDEAGAMSSKAPKSDVIKGDGTAGRSLRQMLFAFQDGTAAATLKCTAVASWNDAGSATQDNIAKGATTGIYSLNAAGNTLTLLNTGIVGDLVAVLAVAMYNNGTGTAMYLNANSDVTGMVIYIKNPLTGVALDMTTLVDAGSFAFYIVYITSS